MMVGVLPRPPRFLTTDEVLTLHSAAIDEYGGADDIRDRGLLDSAVAMPQQGFSGQFAHAVPFEMAAAYAFHICKNHPFVDGNKRTAFTSAGVFLRLNGWELISSEEEATDVMLKLSTSEMDKAAMAVWLQEHTRARSSMELREFFSKLDYGTLASTFGGLAAGKVEERFATIMEAGAAIPAIHAANTGAVGAQAAGDQQSESILRQHSLLLTALYRVAEDMGYEW